jgi:PPK2 family polyphosphate:nucleotide phosphotransferase
MARRASKTTGRTRSAASSAPTVTAAPVPAPSPWSANAVDLNDIIRRYRVTKGSDFHLEDYPTDDSRDHFEFDKDQTRALLARGIEAMREMQERLYADNRWSLLVIFQAMDAAGKDSTIEHVMSGVNPQGCQVHAFKRPSEEELDHDFLWRTTKVLPERGRIGIFNRSYYEEVLVVRVHPQILARQRVPEELVGEDIWDLRLRDIRRFEKFMARQGTRVVKFFLHVSKEEQKRRLLARIDDPAKNWKFETGDLVERARWDDYMQAYEAAIRATASRQAPWYVIPADDKRFARVAVMAALKRELKKLDLRFPELDAGEKAKLGEARAALEKD